MTSAENSDAAAMAAMQPDIQQQALAAYTEALAAALAPLDGRYRDALTRLTEVQQNYMAELGARINAAYQGYADSVSSIYAGSPALEPAAEAYNSFAMLYGQFADPARWAAVIAPAQEKLGAAVTAASSEADPAAAMQTAVETFYAEINDVLASDTLSADLTDAQAKYAELAGALQDQISQGWQQAVSTLSDGIARATEETSAAFDLNAAVADFSTEIGAIGEEMAGAYRDAAEKATSVLQDGFPMSAPAPMAAAAPTEFRSSATVAREATTSPAPAPRPVAATPPPPRAAPDAAAANKTMAARTASMPRASWVNVPEPAADDAGKKTEKGKRGSGAKRTGTRKAAAPKSGTRAKSTRSGASSRGKKTDTKKDG